MREKEEAVMKQMAFQQAQAAMVQHVVQNPNKYPDLYCIKCDSPYFDQAYKAKAVSQFDAMNKLGEPQAVHFNVWICRGCGAEIVLSGPECNMVEKVPAKDVIQ